MCMRSVFVAAGSLLITLCLLAALAFGQGGTGTITGTITDPTGAAVPAANVEAKNVETGAVYSAATTAAGNYTVPNLPVGTYEVTVKVSGFKTYTHTNLAIAATQVLRQDVPLEVGSASESITVEAQASLLQTETGDVAHNVTLEQMDDLPLLGIGTVNSGTSGYRNPYNTLLTLPGVSGYNSSGLFTINGLGGSIPGNPFVNALGETMRIEGQDATSRIFGTYDYTQMAQPNTDAVQEIAYQTSNYAPEFGQAGTVVINMTMKSGTNQYHGTGFEYFVNEDLNAADPFTENSTGTGLYKPLNRRNDFGGTLGGPIIIPKLYNGKNKTFFFFAYEQFLEGTSYDFTDTVPTAAMRTGDFSAISPNGNCSLCAAYGIPTTSFGNDALGNPMYANEIYNPTTRGTTAGGLGYALPFKNNVIPASMMSPSSLAFLALFPQPTNSNLVGNYSGIIRGGRYSAIPSVKIDEILSDKDKLSFYWSRNNTESQISYPLGNADGLPPEIGGYRGTFVPTWTTRLNYDRTISPTILLHLGVGYLHTSFSDKAPYLNFQPSQFDLSGFVQDRQFPSLTGLCGQVVGLPGAPVGCVNGTTTYFGIPFSGFGGMQNVGTSGQIQSQNYEEKPSFNANTTWVKGAHTFKFGAELYLEQAYTGSYSGVTLDAVTSSGIPASTAEPFTPTFSFNGYNQGFGLASFLLGDYASTTQTPNEFYREGSQQWGLFVQDSWKVRRNLTVTYGVRWDYATPERETYGRLGQFDPTLPNPSASNYPGAVAFAHTCNCPFYQSAYPFALGPRLGVAYQFSPKTVIRGGWGFTYQYVANPAGATIGTPGVYPLSGVNPYVNIATPGAIATPTWPSTYSGVLPIPGTVGNPLVPGSDPYAPDQNENRPPRINQFSFGIQQQITPNFIVEASYVANRAVWLGSGPLGSIGGTGVNSSGSAQISEQTYAAYGFYPYPGTGPAGTNNYNDYLLTLQPLNSAGVQARLAKVGKAGFVPYAGFPTTDSLTAALYPFPQYGGLTDSDSPTGASKYDSLQIKATKRLSHGLQAGGTYTWGQGFVRPERQDFFNPASSQWELQQIPPQDLNFNAIYTVPKAEFLPKGVNWLAKDWQVGWFANYQSGQFLTPPTSPTLNFFQSEDTRVAGQPLYTPGVNINNQSTYSPYTTQVLNPNAWAPCAAGAVCASTATYYKDFRGPRTPTENANIGRNFRFGPEGRFNLYIRAEFVNIFNRTLLPAPVTSNPQNGVLRGGALPNGTNVLTGGFGVIDAYSSPGTYYSTAAAPLPCNFCLQGRTGTLVARFSF
jgi:hypothetical protein